VRHWALQFPNSESMATEQGNDRVDTGVSDVCKSSKCKQCLMIPDSQQSGLKGFLQQCINASMC
jgi:hypothetical protein